MNSRYSFFGPIDRSSVEHVNEIGNFPIYPLLRDRPKHQQLIYGRGINDAPYQVRRYKNKYRCPVYVLWCNALQAAKRDRLRFDPAWTKFMDFRAWVEPQYESGKVKQYILDSYLNPREDYDIGPSRSLLVPYKYHLTLRMLRGWELDPDSRYKADGLPTGVTPRWNKDRTSVRYIAMIKKLTTNKQVKLCYTSDMQEAKEVYDGALFTQMEAIQADVAEHNPRLAETIERLMDAIV